MLSPTQCPARVTACHWLNDDTFVLDVVSDGCPNTLADARPGQFCMLRPDWGRDPLLPRAFSILDCDASGQATFLIKTTGRGTRLLGRLVPGERIALLGPLGRPFPAPAADADIEILVAGGVGLAPLLWYAQHTQRTQPRPSLYLLYGARRAADLVLLDRIANTGAHIIVATEDGSRPLAPTADFHSGRVTVALERVIDEVSQLDRRWQRRARILACGPNPMLRAVAALAAKADVPCLVSLEGEMACGVGVCLGCPVRSAPGQARPYLYCCVDGPVFDAREIAIP